MLLAIDIGNTNIALGGFDNDEQAFVARISTDVSKTSDEYAVLLLNTLSMYDIKKETITGAVISSVVPALNTVVKDAIRLIYGVEALVVGPGIKTGINIQCDTPSSVGSDLICACVAAHYIYGSPSLIIDMGTATKIMLTDKNGAFCGVSIIPGVVMGMRALSESTAQLPQVSLETPRSVVGKNTIDSMRSGVIFGNACLIDGMIDRFNDAFGEELPVYATGGLARVIISQCRHDITLDENMVLKGLKRIYDKNN